MDKYLYNSYEKYINTITSTGYMNFNNMSRLLILQFIVDMLYDDYTPCLDEKEYSVINRAISCLFGSSCLTPYYDYSQVMGKLVDRYRNKVSICENSIEKEKDSLYIDFNEMIKNIDNIKTDIEDIKDDVQNNTDKLEDHNNRIDKNKSDIDAIENLNIVVPLI